MSKPSEPFTDIYRSDDHDEVPQTVSARVGGMIIGLVEAAARVGAMNSGHVPPVRVFETGSVDTEALGRRALVAGIVAASAISLRQLL